MLIEERDYRIEAGKLALFVSTYEAHGLQIQIEHLGRFLGYFTGLVTLLAHGCE